MDRFVQLCEDKEKKKILFEQMEERVKSMYVINENGHWTHKYDKKRELNIGGVRLYIRNILWIIKNGLPPKNHIIDIICEEKDCINPDHLDYIPYGPKQDYIWTEKDYLRCEKWLKSKSTPNEIKDEKGSECWNWNLAKLPFGYGHSIKFLNISTLPHRIAYMVKNHTTFIPKKMYICHICDNSSCVNPAHMKLGTPQDNSIQRWNKRKTPSTISEDDIKNDNDANTLNNSNTSISDPNNNNKKIKTVHITSIKKQNRTIIEFKDWTEKEFEQAKARLIKNRLIVEDEKMKTPHWIWKKKKHKDGYCSGPFFGKPYRIHRLSYLVFKNFSLSNDLQVRHLCPNQRACYNPDHLDKGTAVDNAKDKKEQGKGLEGEKSPQATITEKVALAIKNSKGEGTQKERAKRFGTTIAIIGSIDQGATWKHLK